MIVINLFAGPGAGKSTTAAGLFYKMKKLKYSVELVSEYAKDNVWEHADDVLTDQLYLLAKQNRKLERLRGKVNYVVTDSPLLMGVYYGGKWGRHSKIVGRTTKEIFDTYDNCNVFLDRTKPFVKLGRKGTEKEALEADEEIRNLLVEYNYLHVKDSNTVCAEILEYVEAHKVI